MRKEFNSFIVYPYATSSLVKQGLLKDAGYGFVKSKALVFAVGNGEKKNSLILKDDNPENPIVLDIARKKAKGLADYSRLVSTLGGIYVPLVVNDAVWNFSFNLSCSLFYSNS